MKRAEVLRLVAGAGAGVAVLPRAANAQTLVPVRIGCLASDATGDAFYAQDQGFFAKRGLTVSISTAVASAAAASAMVAGDLDVAIADIVVLSIARDKGLPFVALAPALLHSNKVPTLAIAVRDPAIKLGADFNGKIMACATTRGIGYLVTSAWIDNNGGDSKSVKWVEMPFPVSTAALGRGEIDGFCAPEPFITAAADAGMHILLLDKNPIAPVILQGAWFATKDWTAKNLPTARAFAAAMRDANAWTNENRQSSAQILANYTKVPLPAILGMRMRGEFADRFDISTIQPLIDGSAKYNLISASFPARNLIAKL
jgi:NitT/TauT family transport system substrate-binding protein